MIIYQLLPRLFGNENPSCIPNGSIKENGSGTFIDINVAALSAIKRLGVTHIWPTGVLEHASATDYSSFGISPVDRSLVKGKAGSPYAIRDYYDVCPDLARDVPNRLEEFTALVDRCHTLGLKVIMDFVPNHIFRGYASDVKPVDCVDFGKENFYYLSNTELILPVKSDYKEVPARASGNNCFRPDPHVNDWYETVKLNYGSDMQPMDTWFKMRDILSFWASKGVDGFRCDMAEMVPTPFWAWVIPQIKTGCNHPIFIAEIYRPELYRAFVNSGFDYLYDKVGLYDTIKAVSRGELPAEEISRCWQKLGDLQPFMLNFIENHDEQRIASDFLLGDGCKALPALVVSACLHLCPFMLYAGQEFGERGMDAEGYSGIDGRTSIYDYWSVGSLRRFNNQGQFNTEQLHPSERLLYGMYSNLFSLIASYSALNRGATYDLVYANRHDRFNPERHFVFLRYSADQPDELFLIAVNFSDHSADLEIYIPQDAFEHFGIEEQKLPSPIPISLSAWGVSIYSVFSKETIRSFVT